MRPLLLRLLCIFSLSPFTVQEEADDFETITLLEDEGLQLLKAEVHVDSEKGAIPGRGGQDYPVYKVVPKTTFTCTGRLVPGYYADPETRCQVFHICGVGGAKHSFLCPEGSVFNQQYLVCDWWYRAPCGEQRLLTLFYTQHGPQFDIQYSDSFPTDEDTETFLRAETRSPTGDSLGNTNNTNLSSVIN